MLEIFKLVGLTIEEIGMGLQCVMNGDSVNAHNHFLTAADRCKTMARLSEPRP